MSTYDNEPLVPVAAEEASIPETPAETVIPAAPEETVVPVAPEPPAGPEQSHRFRIVHERSDLGSSFPHASSTSEPATWEETLEHVLALGAMIGKDVPAILAAL